VLGWPLTTVGVSVAGPRVLGLPVGVKVLTAAGYIAGEPMGIDMVILGCPVGGLMRAAVGDPVAGAVLGRSPLTIEASAGERVGNTVKGATIAGAFIVVG